MVAGEVLVHEGVASGAIVQKGMGGDSEGITRELT